MPRSFSSAGVDHALQRRALASVGDASARAAALRAISSRATTAEPSVVAAAIYLAGAAALAKLDGRARDLSADRRARCESSLVQDAERRAAAAEERAALAERRARDAEELARASGAQAREVATRAREVVATERKRTAEAEALANLERARGEAERAARVQLEKELREVRERLERADLARAKAEACLGRERELAVEAEAALRAATGRVVEVPDWLSTGHHDASRSPVHAVVFEGVMRSLLRNLAAADAGPEPHNEHGIRLVGRETRDGLEVLATLRPSARDRRAPASFEPDPASAFLQLALLAKILGRALDVLGVFHTHPGNAWSSTFNSSIDRAADTSYVSRHATTSALLFPVGGRTTFESSCRTTTYDRFPRWTARWFAMRRSEPGTYVPVRTKVRPGEDLGDRLTPHLPAIEAAAPLAYRLACRSAGDPGARLVGLPTPEADGRVGLQLETRAGLVVVSYGRGGARITGPGGRVVEATAEEVNRLIE